MKLCFYFFSELEYQLVLDVNSSDVNCSGIRDIEESIELAFRNNMSSDSPWVPLWQSYYLGTGSSTMSHQTIRGYNVPSFGRSSPMVTERVIICGELLFTNEVQFRWMGNAFLGDGGSNGVRVSGHMWALTNVTATLIKNETARVLFEDNFGVNTLK